MGATCRRERSLDQEGDVLNWVRTECSMMHYCGVVAGKYFDLKSDTPDS